MEISGIGSVSFDLASSAASPTSTAVAGIQGASEQLAAVIGELIAGIDPDIGQNLDIVV